MAKTIEEMSATYADNELKLVDEELAENGYSRHTKMKVHLFCGYDIEDACNYGANAVLEEIEDILYRRYSDDGDPRQRWIDMNKLCKELKGE